MVVLASFQSYGEAEQFCIWTFLEMYMISALGLHLFQGIFFHLGNKNLWIGFLISLIN